MASALLASRNEPCNWGQNGVYMRNPNPNPRAVSGDHFHYGVGPEAVVSEDSSSFNRKPAMIGHGRRHAGGVCDTFVSFGVSNYSKSEQRELRRRLELELEQVRGFLSRIESKQIGFQAAKEVSVGSGQLKDRKWALSENSAMPSEQKRMAVLSDESSKLMSGMLKQCGQMLSKLMKQKKSVWFNSPVDVVGMGLHDYFQIVKTPMDLGTVKTKLNKGLYGSPVEFASDVRLTFNNALLYNPQEHFVHKLAGQYLRMFEGLFGPAYDKYEKQLNSMSVEPDENARNKNLQRPLIPLRDATLRSESVQMPKAPTPPPAPILSPMQAMSSVQARQPPTESVKPQSQIEQQQHPNVGRRIVSGKQPKPRAKDLNKRPMSYEEKQKLGSALESLPHDKMNQVLQIVSKRNGEPMQDGDEIELDIEMIDTETLWELDRFVSNCKKLMSKIRRKEEAKGSFPIVTGQSPVLDRQIAESGDRSPVAADTPEAVTGKRSRKLDAGDEDIDIGDEIPPAHYPSVEIEKNAVNASSSSSSDSDSSSDDSDSESSGSEND